MVDVSEKRETVREAVARAILRMKPATLRVIRRGNAPKGDVFGVARTAGILAAKRTPQLIPLCHPLRITGVDVTFDDDLGRGELTVEARVRTVDKTGVEMEALTAAAVAALTVYDMCKALSHDLEITGVRLLEKSGGRRRFIRGKAG
jgi:cyclic pyranopterin monophosphate synthase